jgi:hypothetical protein
MKKREMKTYITVDDVPEYSSSPYFQKRTFSNIFPNGCVCSPENVMRILDEVCWGKWNRLEVITGINTWLPSDQYRAWRKSLRLTRLQLSNTATRRSLQIRRIETAIKENIRTSDVAKKQAASERFHYIESQLVPLREERDRKIAEIRAAYETARKELVDVYDRDHSQASFPTVDNTELEAELSKCKQELQSCDYEQLQCDYEVELNSFRNFFATATAYNEVQP